MVALSIAPVIPIDSGRRSLTTPTGVHYMIGTPSVDVALDLISGGCERIVFSAREPGADWERAEKLLTGAGVSVTACWGT